MREPIQFFKECALRLLRDDGPLSVDLSLTFGLDLHIDARETVAQTHKVIRNAERMQHLLHRNARESREKAQRRRVVSEVFQHDGDVDPLAPRQDLLVVHAVDLARGELLQSDDVVDRRIEGDGIDHASIPPLKITRWNDPIPIENIIYGGAAKVKESLSARADLSVLFLSFIINKQESAQEQGSMYDGNSYGSGAARWDAG